MNIDNLVPLLSEALAVSEREPKGPLSGLPESDPAFRPFKNIAALIKDSWKGADRALDLGDVRWGFGETALATIAIRKSYVHGVQLAVEWLQNFLMEPKIRLRLCAEVAGVAVQEGRVRISDEISLFSLGEAKARKPNVPVHPDLADMVLTSAQSILVAQVVVDPALVSRSYEPVDRLSPVRDDMQLVVNGLSAVHLQPTALASHWVEVEDADIVACLGGSGIGWPASEFRPPGRWSMSAVEAGEVEFISQALQAGPQLRRRLAVAFERINRATKRVSPGDSAIEAAIAVESLLGDEKAELRYRYGLRAARLLEGSFEGRVRVRNAMKGLYDLRSYAVHGGAIERTIKTSTAASDGLQLAAQIARKVASLGDIPDWDLVELGA